MNNLMHRFYHTIMRNSILVFCLISFFPGLAYSQAKNPDLSDTFPNRIFDRKSTEYRTIEMLYAEAGIVSPTTTFPISAREMILLLSRINPEKLDEQASSIYWEIKEKLNKTQKSGNSLSIGAEVAVESYIQTNPGDFGGNYGNTKQYVKDHYPETTVTGEYGHRLTNDENLLYGYADRKPLLNLPVQFSFSPWVTAKFNARVKNVRAFNAYDIPSLNGIVSTNILTSMYQFDLTFPDEGYLSIDGPFFSIITGRTQHAGFGNGKSGNLLFGEHLDYYDNLRIRFFAPHFAYSFQFTIFDGFFGYTSGSLSPEDEKLQQNEPMDTAKSPNFMRYFVTHRFETRIFDRVNFAISEAAMVHSRVFQLQSLNPLMFMHNLYSYATMNVSLSLEADVYIGKGFNMYGQWCSDQVVASTEIEEKPDTFEPRAFAYLIGLSYDNFFRWGNYSAFCEFVLTDPFMYLELGQPDQYAYYRTLEPVRKNSQIRKIAKPVGYRYGPDAIVISVGQQFHFGPFSVNPGFTYFIAGENNRRLKFISGQAGQDLRTPTGIPEHNLIFQSTFEYNADFFTAYVHAGVIHSTNYMNQPGRTATDFQLTLGASVLINATLNFNKTN